MSGGKVIRYNVELKERFTRQKPLVSEGLNKALESAKQAEQSIKQFIPKLRYARQFFVNCDLIGFIENKEEELKATSKNIAVLQRRIEGLIEDANKQFTE